MAFRDWMGNEYPSEEAMQKCMLSVAGSSKAAYDLTQCSIASWGGIVAPIGGSPPLPVTPISVSPVNGWADPFPPTGVNGGPVAVPIPMPGLPPVSATPVGWQGLVTSALTGLGVAAFHQLLGNGGNGGNGGGAIVPWTKTPWPWDVAEPPAGMVKKRWETRVYDNELGYIKLNFYALTDGRIAMYHNYKKYWKMWRPKKHIVLSSDPRMSNLRKLDRVYKRTQKTLRKIAPAPRKTSTQAPSRYLSSVERKQLTGG